MRNINDKMSLSAEACIAIYDKNVEINSVKFNTEYHFGDGLRLKQTLGDDDNKRTTIEKDLVLGCAGDQNVNVKIGQFLHDKRVLKDDQLDADSSLDINGFQLSTDIMGMKFEFIHGKNTARTDNPNTTAWNVIDTANDASNEPTRSAYSLSGDFESCGRALRWCIDYDDFNNEGDIALVVPVEEIQGEAAIMIPFNQQGKSPAYAVRSELVEGYDIAMTYDERKAEHKFSASVCTEVCGTDVTFRYQDSSDQTKRFNICLEF